MHPALAHEVLADALGHYLGIGPDVLPRAYRGANALSEDDGAYWWILAAQPEPVEVRGMVQRPGIGFFATSSRDEPQHN